MEALRDIKKALKNPEMTINKVQKEGVKG